MFTKGTLRYTALGAVNILVGLLAFVKPELVSTEVLQYMIGGNFLIAGADVLKYIRKQA